MKVVFIVLGILTAGYLIFRSLSGEKERIKTLFRVYKKIKSDFPEKSERELLEIVVEEFIPPGKARKLKNTGMSGEQYLDGVFESKAIGIDDLIEHIIVLEFPKKYYPLGMNIEKMEKRAKDGQLSERERLKLIVKNYHKKYLD